MDAKNYHKLTWDNLCCMFTSKKVLKSKSNLNFTKTTNLITWLSHSETSHEMLRFLNTMHDELFKTFSIIYHNLHIGYHELLTNLKIFKLCLHFIKLKNSSTASGFSCFANKMFKISSNFTGKVLKMTQLHEYHFSTNFTLLFYALAVQIWLLRKKSLNDRKLLNIVNISRNVSNWNIEYKVMSL